MEDLFASEAESSFFQFYFGDYFGTGISDND